MKPPFIRTPYNYDTDDISEETGLHCKDKTLTQQQFKDECDLNVLHARYLETGEMRQVEDGLSYGNFEGIFDFQTAMNAVRTAEGLFQQLPARMKNRFDNDPQKLLEFLGDPDNREEAEFLKLVNPKTEPENEPRTGPLPERGTQPPEKAPRTPTDQNTPDATKGT